MPSRLLLGALLTLAASCGDGTGPGSPSGSVSFSHSGATSGTFTASGSVSVADPDRATWAFAERDDANQTITVMANVARPSDVVDNTIVVFPQLTAGTATIPNQASVAINFGQTPSGIRTWSCTLSSGTVVVTSVSDTRARGTFAGTGHCLGLAVLAEFTVTSGSFDVPWVATVHLSKQPVDHP
jgi:hypothetical protein